MDDERYQQAVDRVESSGPRPISLAGEPCAGRPCAGTGCSHEQAFNELVAETEKLGLYEGRSDGE